jgi:hypothetical protein
VTDDHATLASVLEAYSSPRGMATEFQRQQQLLELRAEGLDDTAAQAVLDDFTAWVKRVPTMSTARAWAVWRARNAGDLMFALKASSERITAALHAAAAGLSELARLLRMNPCGRAMCSCHPKPFPAARDYRRRTKHRNRRRK